MAVDTVAARRRFTRTEYHRMAEVGILGQHDRVELIRGEVVEKSPAGRRHKAFVMNLAQALTLRLAERALVAVQSGVVFPEDTELEPDITVLRRRQMPCKDREAHAEDVLLLVEVADRSVYAEAGIPEYWVVDCTTEAIDVHRGPGPGGYREESRPVGPTPLTLLSFPDVQLTTTEIFA